MKLKRLETVSRNVNLDDTGNAQPGIRYSYHHAHLRTGTRRQINLPITNAQTATLLLEARLLEAQA